MFITFSFPGSTLNTTFISSTNSNTTCRDGFSLINGICIAQCDSWEQSPHRVTVAVMVVELLATSVCLLAAILLFVIACIRWRTMWAINIIGMGVNWPHTNDDYGNCLHCNLLLWYIVRHTTSMHAPVCICTIEIAFAQHGFRGGSWNDRSL